MPCLPAITERCVADARRKPTRISAVDQIMLGNRRLSAVAFVLAVLWTTATLSYLLVVSALILRQPRFPLSLGFVHTIGVSGLWITLFPAAAAVAGLALWARHRAVGGSSCRLFALLDGDHGQRLPRGLERAALLLSQLAQLLDHLSVGRTIDAVWHRPCRSSRPESGSRDRSGALRVRDFLGWRNDPLPHTLVPLPNSARADPRLKSLIVKRRGHGSRIAVRWGL